MRRRQPTALCGLHRVRATCLTGFSGGRYANCGPLRPHAWRKRPTMDEAACVAMTPHALLRRLLNVSKTTGSAALSQRSDMVVFLNGEYIPANQAHVGIATHALSYGTGCFEGI